MSIALQEYGFFAPNLTESRFLFRKGKRIVYKVFGEYEPGVYIPVWPNFKQEGNPRAWRVGFTFDEDNAEKVKPLARKLEAAFKEAGMDYFIGGESICI